MSEIEKQKKSELFAKLETLFLDIRDEIEGKEVGHTANQMNQDALDKRTVLGNNLPKSRMDDFRHELREMNPEEEKKLQEWKEFDNKLEGKLEDINILLDELNSQAVEQGQKLQTINELTKKTNRDLTVTTAQLDTQNNRLKELVKKYRAPSKFCMDCCMFLLIIGLVGIIVNMIK